MLEVGVPGRLGVRASCFGDCLMSVLDEIGDLSLFSSTCSPALFEKGKAKKAATLNIKGTMNVTDRRNLPRQSWQLVGRWGIGIMGEKCSLCREIERNTLFTGRVNAA